MFSISFFKKKCMCIWLFLYVETCMPGQTCRSDRTAYWSCFFLCNMRISGIESSSSVSEICNRWVILLLSKEKCLLFEGYILKHLYKPIIVIHVQHYEDGSKRIRSSSSCSVHRKFEAQPGWYKSLSLWKKKSKQKIARYSWYMVGILVIQIGLKRMKGKKLISNTSNNAFWRWYSSVNTLLWLRHGAFL